MPVGTVCKNGGCGGVYQSPESDQTICCHHPGAPIFHEGMKFWSCCTKRTSDFAAFLNQKGCAEGQHKWIQTVSRSQALSTDLSSHSIPFGRKRNPKRSNADTIGIKRLRMWSLPSMLSPTIMPKVT